MSALSSMRDNLRLMARLVRDYDYDEIIHMLRKSADTIWKLRNKLNDLINESDELKDENAKLCALCRDMYLVVALLDLDDVMLQGHGKDADWRTLCERYHELTETDD